GGAQLFARCRELARHGGDRAVFLRAERRGGLGVRVLQRRDLARVGVLGGVELGAAPRLGLGERALAGLLVRRDLARVGLARGVELAPVALVRLAQRGRVGLLGGLDLRRVARAEPVDLFGAPASLVGELALGAGAGLLLGAERRLVRLARGRELFLVP